MKQNTKITLKYYLKHLKNYKFLTFILLAGITLGGIMSQIWTLYVAEFFDILASNGPKEEIAATLITILLLLMLNEFLQFVGWRTSEYTSDYLGPKIMENISNDCFEKMHNRSYDFFTNNFVGSLVKKINKMTFAFLGIYDQIVWNIFPMIVRLTFIISYLWYLHPILGAIVSIWSGLFIIGNYALSIFKLKYDIARSNADTKVTGALADTITNAPNIKLFSKLQYELKNFKKVTFDRFKKQRKSWLIGSHINVVQTLIMVALEFIMLYVAIKLWSNNLITVGAFFIIQGFLLEIFHQLWDFGRNIRELYEKLADAEEMTLILQTPISITDKPNAKKLKMKSGRVDFENVTFGYNKNEGVIENLNLHIKSGEKIALIGPSGGGKTTITKLLLRLYDIQKGKILIDNQDISEVTQDSLRENIALVPQDPILFHRTLMDNIRYARPSATNKEVIAASKLAHCHDFIKKTKDGYKTYVGERGIKLSGGQRQRVAIARAILSNAQILILDEATSSLDSESEVLIQKALENLVKNKTTIIIAHRLSTIQQADRILVLEEGRIIEEGTHADLINEKAGLYKKLWDLQVGGYL